MAKNVKVTKESDSGRNLKFKIPDVGEVSRQKFVNRIESGKHRDYHIRNVNGLKTPVSNPDKKESNNLG